MPTLRARSGAPQRWRIVNAAKSRFFLLDLDGQPFYVIGADGGLQEEAETKESLLVTPGERVDVVVTPTGPPGGTLDAAGELVQPRLRQRRVSQCRRCADDRLHQRADAPRSRRCRPCTATIAMPSVEGATTVDVVLTLPPRDPTESRSSR